MNNEQTAFDIAIVGLGPGGLAAAIGAAQKGQSVLAFSDRNTYIRGQRIVLDDEIYHFLKSLQDPLDKDDEKFFNRLALEMTAQTKDIERYLYKSLLKYKDNITIIQLNKDLNIHSVGQGETRKADFIQLNNHERYYCKNILAADGARRHFAKLMNKDMQADLQYTPLKRQEKHKYHAVVQLKLIEGVATPILNKANTCKGLLAYMQKGWNHAFLPKHYVFPNNDYTKFYFAGEIPEKIFNLTSKEEKDEQLKQWASIFISQKYGVQAEQLAYQKSKKNPLKDNIQANAFEMNMSICTKAFIPLSNGIFAQIGDARRSPNFYLGHGLNDAIKAGLAFSQGTPQDFESVITKMDNLLEQKNTEHVRPDITDLEIISSTTLHMLLSIMKDTIHSIKTRAPLKSEELILLQNIDLRVQELMITDETTQFIMKLYETLNTMQTLMDTIGSKHQTLQYFKIFLKLQDLFKEESTLDNNNIVVSTVVEEADRLRTKDCADIASELEERFIFSSEQKVLLTSLYTPLPPPERTTLLLQLAKSLWPEENISKIHVATRPWNNLYRVIKNINEGLAKQPNESPKLQ